MDNSPQKRNELAARLKRAGCPVDLNAGTDWQTTGDLRPPEVRPPARGLERGKEKHAHIECRDPRLETLHLDGQAIWRLGENPITWERQNDSLGILLPLYLDPRQSDAGVRVEYARVHLVFTDSLNPKSPVTVDHACWINSCWDYVELLPGETKHILLALLKEDSQDLATITTNRTGLNWYREYGGRDFDFVSLPRADYKLEAILMWGGNQEFRKIFGIALNLTKQFR